MRLRLHGLVAAALLVFAAGRALATPSLVMDVATGDVLYENEATRPWFPASLTKLMTVYVTLSAVRDHQISLDTPLVVSRYAASMPPSKMGFRPGTEVTLGNALKMLMVGANVTMLCSVLFRAGIDSIRTIEQDLRAWMEEHDYASVQQMIGSMSHKNCADPSAFERAQYMRAVKSYAPM